MVSCVLSDDRYMADAILETIPLFSFLNTSHKPSLKNADYWWKSFNSFQVIMYRFWIDQAMCLGLDGIAYA